MTSIALTGAAQVLTVSPDEAEPCDFLIADDCTVVVDDAVIAWVGPTGQAPACDRLLDLENQVLIPGFVDSHSHPVFAGDRAGEFEARMTGASYDGGGIASTMTATRAASDEELRAHVSRLLTEMRSQGTTTVEMKSGYGLDLATEQRSLAIAREFTPETTYLGAHVIPPEYRDRREDYVASVTGDMLRACAPHARWIDVFCEPASPYAFDGPETREILTAGIAHGLLPRLHAGQLAPGPGVQLAVEFDAASVDHCTFLTAQDIDALAGSNTVATLLPGVEYCTKSPYPDARRLAEAGITLALATDCNPGSCFSSSMPWCVALAVREIGMSITQALWAATAGGAQALRRDDIGMIRVGNRADFAVIAAPDYRHIAYRPGVPLVRSLALD